MEINRRGPIPPYQQIAAWLLSRIEAGEFGPGQPLPSENDLRQEFGVGRSTARRTYEFLRDEGQVYTKQSRGTYVKADRPKPQADEK